MKPTFDPIRDLPDLTGKVAIVTGANTGIGFITVQNLVRKGAKVYLGARDESKATGALARLEAEGLGPGNGTVEWLKVDLSDPKVAQEAAKKFVEKETRLDILINNAALIASSKESTVTNGISDSIIVNHLSPAVFTLELLPLLKKTAAEPNSDVRIVNVSSDALKFSLGEVAFKAKADFNKSYADSFTNYVGKLKLYGHSKLAGVLFMTELQRRLNTENIPIVCISIHPGAVLTENGTVIIKSLPMGLFLYWLVKTFIFMPVERGADNSLFAAASPQVKKEADKFKGRYITPIGKIASSNLGGPTKESQSVELATDCWSLTEKVLSDDFAVTLPQ